MTITLAPKGLLFSALGGFVKDEESGGVVTENTEKVCNALVNYLGDTTGIICVDGKLQFCEVHKSVPTDAT